eukprot:SAG22_NODE_5430_length_1014_cov_1.698361_1_plen_265_part_00
MGESGEAGTTTTTELVAAQTVVVNVVGLVYLVPGAVARSGSTLVGNAMGSGDAAKGRRLAGLVAKTSLVVQVVQAALLAGCRPYIGQLFSSDPGLNRLVADIFWPWGLLFCAIGGLQCALSGVLEGLGKQRAAAPLVAAAYWAIGLPSAAVLAFQFELGLSGIWAGMTAAVLVHCASYVLICCWVDFEHTAVGAVARANAYAAKKKPGGGMPSDGGTSTSSATGKRAVRSPAPSQYRKPSMMDGSELLDRPLLPHTTGGKTLAI